MGHYRILSILARVHNIATFMTMQDDSCMKEQELKKWMVVLSNIMTCTNNHTVVRQTLIFHIMTIFFNVFHPVIHKSIELTLKDVLS